jgi:NitT/TauT family transport system permease protein
MALAEHDLDTELAGLDALDLGGSAGRGRLYRLWAGLWPKLAGGALFLLLWQLVVWSGWKPEYVLPGPRTVLPTLWDGLVDGTYREAMTTTLWRAARGFTLAIVIGGLIGSAVSQVKLLRTAFGSMITGLMTMPSIAWFPLAILLFTQSESAMLFVVVIGAAPAIANGLIAGTDQIPPVLLRAGRVLGAGRFALWRHVVLPASLPGFLAGLKQGWAFAWRSLLAGELLVIIANRPSLGTQLEFSRQLADAEGMLATMLLILIIGIVIDALFFGALERAVRRRRGLVDEARAS